MAEKKKPGLGDYTKQFFTNWSEYDAPVGRVKTSDVLRAKGR